MNDKINEKVVILPPFKHFIMTVGEIPTSYLESMTYYEMLVWFTNYLGKTVIPAINENGEAVLELQNLFVTLQTYVNTYFDNLDVQEEINNKLDEMATSGVLQGLINNIFSTLEEQINTVSTDLNNELQNTTNTLQAQIQNVSSTLSTQIQAVESGPPLTASSTAGMTNTSKIYVNTTDGNWYYYDGDSWEIGGAYQAVNLFDNSVTYNTLDTTLKTNLEDKTSTTSYSPTLGKIFNKNGVIFDNSSYAIYEINVQPFETYKIHMSFIAFSGDFDVAYLFKDTNGNVLSYATSSDITIINNYYDKVITIPYNCTKLLINTNNETSTTNNSIRNYITKVTGYTVDNIGKEQLDSTMQTFFNDVYESVTPTLWIDNCFYRDTGPSAFSGYQLYTLAVNPGEKYKITSKQIYANPIVCFTSKNFDKEFTINDNTYIFNNTPEYIVSETSGYQFEDYEFTIPSYCNKLYINKIPNDSTFSISKVTSYSIKASDVISDYNKIGFNKWIAIGDSLTEVNFRALNNYVSWIKQDIPSLSITNLGKSGTGYMNPGDNVGTFINRISSITSYNLSNTIITVMGSINDMSYVNDNLGSLGDTTTDTVYGSMYQFFNTLFTTFNGVRIGCISPLNWKNSNVSSQFELYKQALKETCELFNVPYLDISDKSNLRPNNETFLNTYYAADGTGSSSQVDTGGVHPNSAGHHLFYGRIKEFINTL